MRKVLLGTVLLMSLLNNLEVSLAEVEILPDQTFEQLKVTRSRFNREESDSMDSETTFTQEEIAKLQELEDRYGKPFPSLISQSRGTKGFESLNSLTEKQKKEIENVMEELRQLQKEISNYSNRG